MDNTKQQSEETSGERDKAVRDFVDDVKDFAANLEMLLANDTEYVAKITHGYTRDLTAETVRLNGMTLDWADREMNQLMEKNNKLRAKLTFWASALAEHDRRNRIAEFKRQRELTTNKSGKGYLSGYCQGS